MQSLQSFISAVIQSVTYLLYIISLYHCTDEGPQIEIFAINLLQLNISKNHCLIVSQLLDPPHGSVLHSLMDTSSSSLLACLGTNTISKTNSLEFCIHVVDLCIDLELNMLTVGQHKHCLKNTTVDLRWRNDCRKTSLFRTTGTQSS